MNNVKKRSGAELLRYLLKGSLYLFIISIAANLAVMLLNVLIPQIISFTVDSVLGDVPADGIFLAASSFLGGTENLRQNIWIIALIILFIALVMAVFRYIQSYSNTCANEKMMERMRNVLFSHVQRLPVSWHASHRTGDIIQRCTSDTQTILTFISNQLMPLIRIIALVALSLGFMFAMHWQLALIASVFIPLLVAYSTFFYSKVARRFRQCDEEEGVLSTMAQENFTSVRVIRAFGREKYERDRFEKQNTYYTGLWVRLERFLAVFWTTSDFVAALQLLLIIAAGTLFCIDGSLTAGDFVAFVSYNTMLVGPVRQLGRIISNMSKAGVSLGRIGEILNSPAEEYEGESWRGGDIKFEHVSFSYDGKPVLKDINFTLPEGKTLGILGATGSGKSTIALLLDGLYSPVSGRITIGGRDISSLSLKDLRSNVGLVLQESYIYSRTVGQNIAMAADADMAAVGHAAQVACVDDNIRAFTDGYDTVVGERGVTLSGGQKQRVAIARTIVKKSPVIILDDSLSAVDSRTDEDIRRNLSTEFKNATVIIISHRVSTVMHADNIIVLRGGEIAESGTHGELLSLNGEYKRVYDLQTALPGELKGEA